MSPSDLRPFFLGHGGSTLPIPASVMNNPLLLWSLNEDRFLTNTASEDPIVILPTDPRFPLIETAVYSEQHGLLDGIALGSITRVTSGKRGVVVEIKTTTPESTGDNPWDHFDSMTREEILEQPLSKLRPYARFRCNIVGASKLRGGKPVLVERILESRGV